MKHAKLILMTLAVLALSAFVYADNSYQVGFEQGYKHGVSDRRENVNFDLDHYRINLSDNDSEFREGFKDGYVEGYSTALQNDENYGYQDRNFRSEPSVLAFKHKNFDGTMMQFPTGRYPDLDDMNWDDSIESIQVPSNVRVILFEHKNFKGQSLILENDVSNLGELNFKKRAESMIIEPRY